MDRQNYAIEVSHVSKSFKDNKVLRDVSLSCQSGKIYGLVGHNGSGKTVLFKSICGFLSCDEGTITVNGKVMGKDKDMLTDAGIIIEEPAFCGHGVDIIIWNFFILCATKRIKNIFILFSEKLVWIPH